MNVWSIRDASGCAPSAFFTEMLAGTPRRASIVGPPYTSEPVASAGAYPSVGVGGRSAWNLWVPLRITSDAVPPLRRSIFAGTVSCSVNGLSGGLDTGPGQTASVRGAVEGVAMPAIPALAPLAPPLPGPAAAGPDSRAEPAATVMTETPANVDVQRALRMDRPGGGLTCSFVASVTMTAPRIDVDVAGTRTKVLVLAAGTTSSPILERIWWRSSVRHVQKGSSVLPASHAPDNKSLVAILEGRRRPRHVRRAACDEPAALMGREPASP